MIYIGDCHGKTSQLAWMLKHNPNLQSKKCFQLGDMGLGFKGVELANLENLYFIRGNHDNPQLCKAHPCYVGDSGYWPEEELFWVGGAWSIDKEWRIPGISWWPDEEQSPEALHAAFEKYVRCKPRIVATHEAPTVAAVTMINGLIIPPRTDIGSTNAEKLKGVDYDYYKAKLGCVNTRTSQYLQQMFDAHQPEHWIFGHYHIRRDFEIKGTQFHCLPELDSLEIVLASPEEAVALPVAAQPPLIH